MRYVQILIVLAVLTGNASAQEETTPATTTPTTSSTTLTPEIAAQLDTLAKRAEELSKDAEDSARANKDLRSKVASLERQNENLRNRIGSLESTVPNQIAVGDRFWTDRSAAFRFTTNRVGVLIATLKERGGKTFPELRSPKPEEEHTFTWLGLAPGREYDLEVAVAGATGEPTATKLSPSLGNASLAFKTEDLNEKPKVTIDAAGARTTSQSILLGYKVDEPAFVAFECRQRIPGKLETIACRNPVTNRVSVDALGRPAGDKVAAGSNVVTIAGLDPDTEYVVRPVGYDEKGLAFQDEYSSVLRTAKRLDFSGPVRFQIQPDAVRITWMPTVKPDSAQVRLVFEKAGQYLKEGIYDGQTGMMVAEISLAQLTRALQVPSTELPTIEVAMAGDATNLTRQFAFGFSIQPASGKLTAEQKRAAKDLATSVAKPGQNRLSWKDLVELGIPLVLSLL